MGSAHFPLCYLCREVLDGPSSLDPERRRFAGPIFLWRLHLSLTHPDTHQDSKVHILLHPRAGTRVEMAQATDSHDHRLQLIVAQQDLQGHHRRTEHWALVVLSPESRTADVLQLAGNMDTFHFEAFRVPDVLKLGDLCGGCRVGDIAADSIDNLRDKLAAQRIILHDKMWDCQDWLLEAIRELKDETGGWVQIDDWFTERGLREKLREERELWERADDHFFERLYAQA